MTEPTILPIGSEKVSISLNIEQSVKDLIDNIVKKGEGDDLNLKHVFDSYPDTPSSLTGVLIHYLIKGVKEDLGIEFDEKPRSLKERKASSGGGGMRFTKEMKNSILDRCNYGFYDESIGEEEIFNNIRGAIAEKKQWESLGYVLVPEKTKPPMKEGSEKYNNYLALKEAAHQKRIENGKNLQKKEKS